MDAKSIDLKTKIHLMQAEKSNLEQSASRQGYSDASRRNRLAEELKLLQETDRRNTRLDAWHR